MASRDTLPCSATFGKIAAVQNEPIARFSGASDKLESIQPEVKPAG